MKPPITTYYFLGANSESGFYSLYDDFCRGPADTLHIIKGGPGTGKSTFMRRIGHAAEERGLDVEYILCSGDPESLDGIYIPALHTGWADGTAPHVLEPKQFGISAVYEDLGRFCRVEFLREHRASIAALTEEYRQSYKKAYSYLHGAAAIRKAESKTVSSDIEEKIRKRARSKIRRELSPAQLSAEPIKRFISAISCQGKYFATETINAMCSRMCVLESAYSLEQIFFHEIRRELDSCHVFYVLCPSPLCPDLTEAILLPTEGLCFISSQTAPTFKGTVRTIHLDKYLPTSANYRCSVPTNLTEQLLSAAITHLKKAKQLHDELEQFYRPALDIEALNDYTDSVIQNLF